MPLVQLWQPLAQTKLWSVDVRDVNTTTAATVAILVGSLLIRTANVKFVRTASATSRSPTEMDERSEVPPETLSVGLVEGGITVTYSDGREVFYRGPPTPIESPHETAPGKDTHVLVTDGSETQGVLLYINEDRTEDAILENSGVGRVLLSQGEESTLFPGVTVRGGGLRDEIIIDHELVDGRVFVFEEDQFEEFAYELVPETER